MKQQRHLLISCYKSECWGTFDIVSEVNNWYEVQIRNWRNSFRRKLGRFNDDEQPTTMSPFNKKKERVPGTLIGLTIVIDPGHGGKIMELLE